MVNRSGIILEGSEKTIVAVPLSNDLDEEQSNAILSNRKDLLLQVNYIDKFLDPNKEPYDGDIIN